MSETSKYRHLTRRHCMRPDGEPGCGVDIASGGDPVVPWAWQLELHPSLYLEYNSNHPYRSPVQLCGDAAHRCAEVGSLDFVYASHILEDYPREEWEKVINVWVAMLKPGGRLIILVPERNLWADAISKGQPPNCNHRYEPLVGDVWDAASNCGVDLVEENLTNQFPGDYSILAIFSKRA